MDKQSRNRGIDTWHRLTVVGEGCDWMKEGWTCYQSVSQIPCCSWKRGSCSIFRKWISLGSHRRMGCGKDFTGMELHFSGTKVPCPLSQSWKRCSRGSSRVRRRASVQQWVWLSIQAKWSPLVHVWSPTLLWVTWAQRTCPCNRSHKSPMPWRVVCLFKSLYI